MHHGRPGLDAHSPLRLDSASVCNIATSVDYYVASTELDNKALSAHTGGTSSYRNTWGQGHSGSDGIFVPGCPNILFLKS